MGRPDDTAQFNMALLLTGARGGRKKTPFNMRTPELGNLDFSRVPEVGGKTTPFNLLVGRGRRGVTIQ